MAHQVVFFNTKLKPSIIAKMELVYSSFRTEPELLIESTTNLAITI